MASDKLDPKVVAEISGLVEAGVTSGRFVSAWESVQQALLAKALAWRTRVQPDFVGPHAQNRSQSLRVYFIVVSE